MSDPHTENDLLGWRETRWGMTPTVLAVTVGQELRSFPKRKEYQGLYADHFIPAVDITGEKFEVVFQMSPSSGCLQQVLVHLESDPKIANGSLFRSLGDLLAKKYGPATVRTGELPDNGVIRWVLPATTVELGNMFIEGIISQLSIAYRPTVSTATANV